MKFKFNFLNKDQKVPTKDDPNPKVAKDDKDSTKGEEGKVLSPEGLEKFFDKNQGVDLKKFSE